MSDFDIQALIKNQRKEASYLDAEYTVVVSGGGAEDNVEKPKFKALLPGVRLHFLRYGLFPKEADLEDKQKKSGAVRVHDSSDEEFTFTDAEAINNDFSSTDNFMLGKTILNQGYVYLINVDDDTDCHELEVGLDGKMSHIIWDKENFYPSKNIPKDKRVPEEKEDLHYKLIINERAEGEARSFWISYSPVQWSYAMFVKVLEMTDEQRKERGMVLVSTAGIQKDQEPAEDYIVAYDKLVYAYDRATKKQYNYKTQIEQVIAQEKAEDRKGNNTVYEDMFIALHDPIGAAQDIKKELQSCTGEFTALVESIQTGESLDDAITRLADNKPRPEIDDEYRAMVSLALTSYLMVYAREPKQETSEVNINPNSNARNRRRINANRHPNSKYDGGVSAWNAYGRARDFQHGDRKRARSGSYNPDRDNRGQNGLDRSKVEGVLGVDLRAYKREDVQVLRNELGNFIQTKYFRSVNDFYLGSNECKIEGLFVNMELLKTLYINPFDTDKSLLLPQDYKKEDTWQDFVLDLLKDDNSIKFEDGSANSIMPEYADLDTLPALINTKSNLNTEEAKKNGVDIADKFSAALQALFFMISHVALKDIPKQNGQVVLEIPKRLKVIVDRLNQRASIDGNDAFAFKNNQIYMQLKAQGARLDVKDAFVLVGAPKQGWTSVLKGEDGAELISRNRKGVNSHRKRKKGEKLVRATYEVEVPAQQRIKLTTSEQLAFRVDKLVNGKTFTGLLAAFQVFNMNTALAVVANDLNFQNTVGTITIAAELREAIFVFKEAVLKSVTKDKKILSLINTKAVLAGATANMLTASVCGIQMVEAFDKRDTDAAVAFGLAGLAYGVAAVASVDVTAAAVLGMSAAGGPVVFIAVGIGLGLITIAYLLTDTEAETYFKNFLLSDHCKDYYRPRTRDYSAPDYTRLLIDKKKELVDDEDYEETLMNPQDAEATLFDITTCNSMSFEPHGKKEITILKGHDYDVVTTKLKAEAYTIRLGFNHFFQDIDQAEFGALIFENNQTNAIELDTDHFIEENKEGNELVLKVTVPRKYQKASCQLMVVVRLVIDRDQGMYFPYPMLKKQERWLGARVATTHNATFIVPDNFMSSENVLYDTLDNLKKVNKWQNWVERILYDTN